MVFVAPLLHVGAKFFRYDFSFLFVILRCVSSISSIFHLEIFTSKLDLWIRLKKFLMFLGAVISCLIRNVIKIWIISFVDVQFVGLLIKPFDLRNQKFTCVHISPSIPNFGLLILLELAYSGYLPFRLEQSMIRFDW